jgi:prepilin-type N-terminal cleavage/methylation domain-containing protein
MLQKLQTRRRGFTLVEIMIVVAIIAMLAAIALPNFMRARKRAHAARVLEDLRLIDAAVDQYAIEYSLMPGAVVPWDRLTQYFKLGTKLYYSNHTDLLGHDYGATQTVDLVPFVPPETYDALLEVAPASFWSPFRVP